MKNTFILLALLFLSQGIRAQNREWSSPYSGYSNTSHLAVDKVEFARENTLMHVTANAGGGTHILISSNSYLAANGKRYAIQSASEVGLDALYTMPDSGKVHFVMQFNPVPASTRVMHFSEGDDDGWVICNIRNEKDDLPTNIPSEWRNVRYEMDEELPESKFSDDSTRIHIKILNYTPEAGKDITVYAIPIDFDVRDYHRKFSISKNGTAKVGLHPCFPMTVQMCVGNGSYFPVLVVPGKDLSILMDFGKQEKESIMDYKGELAKTNYEVNVKDAKNFPRYRTDEAYFDSILFARGEPKTVFLFQQYRNRDAIKNSDYSHATKEWMMMNNDYLHSYSVFNLYNRYVFRKIEKELTDANSSIMKNNRLWVKVRRGIGIDYDPQSPYSVASSKKATFCPYYMETFNMMSEEEGDAYAFYKDYGEFFLSMARLEDTSEEMGYRHLEQVKDSALRAFYPVAVKRWKEYVDRMNKTPHIHFNEHGDMEGEELKRAVLKDYQGKNVVFLVYDRTKCGKELGEVESLLKKFNRKNVVFIHVDKLDCLLMGARPWYEAAKGRTGEHYGGSRVRYYTMFPNYQDETKVMYSFYDSSGNNTLETQDKEVAFDAIRKLQRK